MPSHVLAPAQSPIAPAMAATGWRRIAANWLQPVVVFGAFGIWFAQHRDPRFGAVLPIALAIAGALVVYLFEQLMPAVVDARHSWIPTRIDLFYSAALYTLVPLLLRPERDASYALARALAPATGPALWPADAPLWARVALAVMVGEFCSYWLHRAQHHNDFLWRFHSGHHAATYMNWWKGPVNHPLEHYFLAPARFLLLVLLGAGREEMQGALLLVTLLSLFAHANIALRDGPFGWIFCTPARHYRHHALDIAVSRSNYGDALIIWDRLFGTFRDDGPDAWRRRLGIDDGAEISLGRHLLLPFRRAKK